MATERTKTIDITPSWGVAAQIYAQNLRYGDREEAKTRSEQELIRLGQNYQHAMDFLRERGLLDEFKAFAVAVTL